MTTTNIASFKAARLERTTFEQARSIHALRSELTTAYVECMTNSTGDVYAAYISDIYNNAIQLSKKEDAAKIIAAIARLTGNDVFAAAA